MMIEALKKIVGLENVLYGGAEKAPFSHVWGTDVTIPDAGRLICLI